MVRALIVVDVQNDFCEGGALAVAGGAAVASAVDAAIVDGGYDLVVATRDHHVDPGPHFSATPDFVDSWPPHCVAGTTGAAQHPNLTFSDWNGVFLKGDYQAAYSGFEGAERNSGVGLAQFLRDHRVTEVDVCGIAADYCVNATARDARREGFTVRVLVGLTAAVHPANTPRLVDEWRESGILVG